MLTFRQFLTEKQEIHSIANTILFNEYAPPVIMTPTMMKRLDYTIPGVTAFHITSDDLIRNLQRASGKKSNQLSVLIRLNNKDALGGIETEGGIVAELEGQIDAYFATDAFTGRLKGGRRSILINPHSDFGASVKRRYRDIIGTDEATQMIDSYLKDFANKLRTRRNEILDKYLTPFFMKLFPQSGIKKTDGHFEAFEKAQMNDEFAQGHDMDSLIRSFKGGRQAYQNIVREYMDAQERIIRENPHLKKLFLMPMVPTGDQSNTGAYDEAMMSNFTIKMLHIYDAAFDAEYRGDIVEDLKKIAARIAAETGLPTKVWVDVTQLMRHINKTGTDLSDIMKKKVASG